MTAPVSRKTSKTGTSPLPLDTAEKLTNFAWIGSSETGDVRLSGAWMNWHTIPMTHSPSAPLPIAMVDDDTSSPVSSSTVTFENSDLEKNNEREAWTLRTQVPPGMHHFQFVVDGVWKHSPLLPTSQQGAGCNMRVITEPPDEPDATTVRTEFVWMDDANESVLLCGEWRDWQPMSMKKVAGGHWSMTTTVPVGEKRFRYIVDGVPRHSTRHAIIGANNVFNIIRIDDVRQSDASEDKDVDKAPQSPDGLLECSTCCTIS